MFFIFNFQMQWGVQDFHDTKKMLNLKFPDLFLLWYATLQSFRMETGRSVSSKGIATSDLVPWDKTPTLDPKLSFLLVLLLLMMVMMSWVGLRCWCKFPDCLSFHKTPQKKNVVSRFNAVCVQWVFSRASPTLNTPSIPTILPMRRSQRLDLGRRSGSWDEKTCLRLTLTTAYASIQNVSYKPRPPVTSFLPFAARKNLQRPSSSRVRPPALDLSFHRHKHPDATTIATVAKQYRNLKIQKQKRTHLNTLNMSLTTLLNHQHTGWSREC